MLDKLINFFKILFNKKNITIKYGVVGTMSYLIYLALLIIFIEIFHFKEFYSSIITNAIAIILSFLILKIWVFQVKSGIRSQFFKYNVVGIISYCVNNFCFWVLVINLDIHYLTAQFILFFIIASLNFVLNTIWTFR